jgi:hypothetical protein
MSRGVGVGLVVGSTAFAVASLFDRMGQTKERRPYADR